MTGHLLCLFQTDIVIAVAVGVGVPSVAFIVALILFYRYKIHRSRYRQFQVFDELAF